MSAPDIEAPRTRSRIRATRTDVELCSWLFMRMSGVVLVALITLHLVMNLVVGDGIQGVDFAFVAGKWADPFWQVVDLTMLWLAMIHGANGVTDYGANTVKVRENMSPAAQVKTLTHELAHVMLHGPNNPDASGHRGVGEVEAESVALMVGAAHGMDTTGYTIPYVTGWASTVKDLSPVEVVQAAGERVRKAATEILGQLDTSKVGAGDPPGLVRDTSRREARQRLAPQPLPESSPSAAVGSSEPVRGL